MRKALVLGCLIMVCGAVATTAAPLSGAWSFWMQTEVDPFSIASLGSVLEVDYVVSNVTLSSTVIVDREGLDNVFYDVSGPMGGFALRSILDFNAEEAQLRAWLASAVTAIGGVNLYATLMMDNVGTTQTPSMGTGLTLGGWGWAGDLSIWGQTRFNMNDSSVNVYKYGYEWLLDHFIFQVCDTWQKPSGYLDVQTSGCTLAWTGADVFVEMPFSCFTLLTSLSVSCSGFDSVLFSLNDIDLGLNWLDLKWIDVFFTVDSKSVNMVLDLSVAESACITPYLVLEGSGGQISGFSLKALKMAYSWDSVTFKAGHLFDEDGWYDYLNYTVFSEWGWTWDGELSYLAPCKVPSNYDEYFGLIIDGDSCCGGSTSTSLFAWFDTGSATAGIFDWVETRASVKYGITANLDLSFAMSVTNQGMQWLKMGANLSW